MIRSDLLITGVVSGLIVAALTHFLLKRQS
jgi:hypothetical protein